MNQFVLILSGHDDACCRSHSLRNLLMITYFCDLHELSEKDNLIIFVHPAEWTWLYKIFLYKKVKSVTFKRRFSANLVKKNATIWAAMSSTLADLTEHNNVTIFDPTLTFKQLQLIMKDNWKVFNDL